MKSSGAVYKKLDDYQRQLTAFCLDVKTPGLFAEQGTGKTYITGGVIEQLWGPEFNALLVVPLSNLDSTWLTFLREHFDADQVYDNWDEFAIACKAGADLPRVLVLHYEAVPALIKKLRKFKWTLIAYDESQRLKDRGSRQSRDAAKLRHSAPRRMILSGTPLDKQPKDLWAQLRFLKPDALGERWGDFEAEYFEPLPDFANPKKQRPRSMRWFRAIKMQQIMRSKRAFDEAKLPQFIGIINSFCVRVTKDVLDLPPLNVIPTPVALYGDQRRLYDQLAKNQVVRLPDKTRIVAPLKVVLVGKLHQMCGGTIKDEDDIVHTVGRAKLRKTLHLVKSKRKPIVIFARYLEEIRQIEEGVSHIVDTVAVITGRTKKRDRPGIIKSFQQGEIDVLVCQLKTGGVGLDLFRSCVGIMYSLSFSFIDYDQAIARLHRRGQESAVEFFVLYAVGTVDEAIYRLISKKRNVTRRVLTQLELFTWRRKPKRSMGSATWRRPSRSTKRTPARSCATRDTNPRPAASTGGTRRRNSTRS